MNNKAELTSEDYTRLANEAAYGQPLITKEDRLPQKLTVPEGQTESVYDYDLGAASVTKELTSVGNKMPITKEKFIPTTAEMQQAADIVIENVNDWLNEVDINWPDTLTLDDPRENPEQVKRMARTVTIGTGALVGAQLAAPAAVASGPFAPAVIGVGSTLGVMTATAWWGALTGQSAEDQFNSILSEGESELYYAGFGQSAGKAIKILGPRIGNMIGVGSKEAKEISKIAELQDLKIGATVAAEESSLSKGLPKVLGIFPFAGGPIRRNYKIGTESIDNKLLSYVDEVGPNATLYEAGVDVTTAAKNVSKEWLEMDKNNYKMFYGMAEEMGNPAIIPTNPIKQAIIAFRTSRILRKQSGEIIEEPKIVKEMESWLDDLTELPDNISPAQLRQIQKDTNKWYKKSEVDETKLGQLKKATEAALEAMDISKIMDDPINRHLAPKLKATLEAANNFHSAGMILHASPSAKIFSKTDKNFFNSKVFKGGNISPDQVIEPILRSKSPQNLIDLNKLIGDDAYREVARQHINKVVNSSKKSIKIDGKNIEIIDYRKIEADLNLNDETGVQMFDELTKHSSINPKLFKDFLKVAKANQAFHMPSASTFLSRRVAISGIKGLTAMVASSVALAPTVATILITRTAGKVISSPKGLRWMTTMLDDTVDDAIRRTAMVQLVKTYPEAFSEAQQ